MDDYQIDALKDFAELVHGNVNLTTRLIEILKEEVQPGGIEQPYDGSLYPDIMAYIYIFNKNPKIYANCDEVNPASDDKRRTPSSAIRRHFDSFTITKEGKPRGAKTYVPPYFMWFCSLPTQCEQDKTRNRREIAKSFYNNVLEKIQKSKIPNSLKKWDERWSPPWIGVQPFPIFYTWDAVRDTIEGKKQPGVTAPPEPNNSSWENKRDILDPYNPKGIKFFGRENEIERLNAFAYDRAKFKIWTVIAPSGAGKTRLVFEWTQKEALKDHWEVYYLGQTPNGELVYHDPDHVYKNPHRADSNFNKVTKNGADWQNWAPPKDTILIIDYVSGFEEVINGIVNRCVRQNTGLDKRVRLLILDHFFPETLKSLYRDRRWAAIEDVVGHSSVFYRAAPLFLTKPDDQFYVMKEIIRSVALRPNDDGVIIELSDEQVQQSISYLQDPSETKGTWHPLFAALVGDALRDNRPFHRLDRRKLIESYLDKKNRLPWKYPKLKDKERNKTEERNRLWASAFIAAATITGGLKWKELVEGDYSGLKNVPENFAPVKTICQRVISQQIKEDFFPFIPDIVGESFFLLFLEEMSDSPQIKYAFYRILSNGDKHTQSRKAIGLVTTIRRLIRNLLNDDQSLNEITREWNKLKFFLDSNNYSKKTYIRWAVSAALLEISEQIKTARNRSTGCNSNTADSYPEGIDFFQSISVTDILPNHTLSQDVLIATGESSVKYFRARSNMEEINADDLDPLIAFLSEYDLMNPANPALHLSIKYRFKSLTNQLIGADYDLTKLGAEKSTALIYACLHSQKSIALNLIKKMNRVDHQNISSWTALIMSCGYGYENIAHTLIKKMDKVDHRDERNRTALMYACTDGRMDSHNALMPKYSNDVFFSSHEFIRLVLYNGETMESVAHALISKMKRVDQQDEYGKTALMYACESKMENVALTLISKMKKADQQDEYGKTALMYACESKMENVALTLISKMKRVNQKDIRDKSAFRYALKKRMIWVGLNLIFKGIKVR